MPKHLIKRYLPDHDVIRNHKHLRLFGRLIHDPNLWHMNRRSVSGAFAAGLFWAFIPVPIQMIAAAATSILTRVNLPISVALVWISNPITIPPIFYFNYLVGTWILETPVEDEEFELTIEWFQQSLSHIWQPLFLGSLIMAIIMGCIGYFGMRGLWRLHLVNRIKQRRARAKG